MWQNGPAGSVVEMVPSSLRGGLVADIPAANMDGPIMWHVRLWRRGRQWTVAAAAVLFVASAVVWFGASWGRHARLTADANNSLRPMYATDHNSFRPSDTNLSDTNSLR